LSVATIELILVLYEVLTKINCSLAGWW